MFTILWQFVARADCLADFERAYGTDGDWAQLFARAAGYRGSRLLRDTASDHARDHTYVVLDQWDSRAAFDAFKQKFAAEYQRLDEQCTALTAQEMFLGEFEAADRPVEHKS